MFRPPFSRVGRGHTHRGGNAGPGPIPVGGLHLAEQRFPAGLRIWTMATRWGLCSAGKICHDFSVALRTLDPKHHQIVAVAARDLQHAENFAKRHHIPRAYGSYDALAKDPDVDIIYIGTLQINHLSTGKLFMTHKKSVLIEKPLAMNSREVQELVSAAQDNSVFLMEAMWTRFFPLSYELRRLLSQREVGDVQIVRAESGNPLTHLPRCVDKKLGGGALLVVGIYCLHFVFMVFNGEKPESVQTTAQCLDTGVDGTTVLVLKFSRNRLAVCTCSVTSKLSCNAVITGTKGTIQIPQNMWCPTTLVVNGAETEFPLPEPPMPLNYVNSVGLRYEAEEVRRCLLNGLKESPEMPWAHSKLVAETVDEAWRQMGVAYEQNDPQ